MYELSGDGGEDDTVPSVRDVMDGMAVDAGLHILDADSFGLSDEESSSRDVASAVSSARALLQDYHERYVRLSDRLSRAQAHATASTRESRDRSLLQLQTMTNLEERCADLVRDLAADEASGAGEVDVQGEVSRGLGLEAAPEDVRGEAEANALAARYRSLLQHRKRVRSAVRLLETSERAAAELKAGLAGSNREEGMKDALKSVEAFRVHLDDRFGLDTSTLDRPAAVNELERVLRARLDWMTSRVRSELVKDLAGALRDADPLASDGDGWDNGGGDHESTEIGTGKISAPGAGSSGEATSVGAKRRRGFARVKDAVRRLLDLQFGSSHVGEASQVAGLVSTSTSASALLDTSAAHVNGTDAGSASAALAGSTGVRPPAQRAQRDPRTSRKSEGRVASWALDGLLEPVAVRFRFHFEGDRPTNRADRPEWFLAFLLRALEAYRPLLRDEGVVGRLGGVYCLAYFARSLALLARRRLRAQLGATAADSSLLSHAVEEALAFDKRLDHDAGYAECPRRFSGQAWPRCVEVFASEEGRFRRWMEADASVAEAKLSDTMDAPEAWAAVEWKNGPSSTTPVTRSAVDLCQIFWDVTERYRPLREPRKQLRFARTVQEPLLRSYRDRLYRKGMECRLGSVFRDEAGESDGNLAASWAASALGAPVGSDSEDKTPIGRWRTYCEVVASCAYVHSVLRESEDDILLAELSEVAAAAAMGSAGDDMFDLGGASSLTAMGTVVGAAVGGVSQAVTSVASTAETATAEVVRAVGAQGTIIGPTQAISAALTTLKGAARIVAHASSAAEPSSLSPTEIVDLRLTSESSGMGGHHSNGMATDGNSAEELAAREAFSPGGVAPSPRRGMEETKEQLGGRLGGRSTPGGDGLGAEDAKGALGLEVGQAGAGGAWEGSVFGEEVREYGVMLQAMIEGAVSACRDGFLWCTRSFLRSWDRGIAVVIPESSVPGTSTGAGFVTEASGKLVTGVEMLSSAIGIAEGALPPTQFREFWTALAGALDAIILKQIVARRQEITQDEGLQLRADLKALMTPFSLLARRRPARHFPQLTEAVLLLSLERSQLRSLASALEAHGGGVEETRRGTGWDGWREAGGSFSPEGAQMRDMLENVGVQRLGPVEASLLLEKRLRGDRREQLQRLSAAAATATSAAVGPGVEEAFLQRGNEDHGQGVDPSQPASNSTLAARAVPVG